VYVPFKLLCIFAVAVLVQAVMSPAPSPTRGPMGATKKNRDINENQRI